MRLEFSRAEPEGDESTLPQTRGAVPRPGGPVRLEAAVPALERAARTEPRALLLRRARGAGGAQVLDAPPREVPAQHGLRGWDRGMSGASEVLWEESHV